MFLSTVLLSACLAAQPATPEEAAPPKKAAPYELKYDPVGDPLIAGFAAFAWITTESVSKSTLAPSVCHWCDRTIGGDETLNAIDAWARGVRWPLESQHTADTLSNVTGFVLLPLAVVGMEGYAVKRNHAVRFLDQDLVMIAEATALASLFNQVVKFTVGRERPFVHALGTDEERAAIENATDNNLSFFSGHTTFAFSLALSAAVIAELRGYEGRWLFWAVGVPLAASTAYFRMAADKHYLSDVLVGMGVATAFGVGIPLLFHGRVDLPTEVRLVPAPDGAALVGRF